MITAAEKYRWCFEPSCIAHICTYVLHIYITVFIDMLTRKILCVKA